MRRHSASPLRLSLVCLAGGLSLAGLVPVVPGLPWLSCGLLAACVLCLQSFPGPPAGFALLGLVLALQHGLAYQGNVLPAACTGQVLAVTGRVSGFPERVAGAGDSRWTRLHLIVEAVDDPACAGPRRLRLGYYGDAVLAPGQRWRFRVKLRQPRALANPGTRSFRAWYAEQGIHALGSIQRAGAERLPDPAPGLWGRIEQWRWQVAGRIGSLPLAADTGGVLRAITVGDRRGLSPVLRESFQRFGVSHLLVVSGLHVGLSAAAGYWLAGLLLGAMPLGVQAKLRARALSGLALATAYAALAGFTVPVQRAWVMLACFVLAACAHRPGAPGDRLLLAAVLVLLANPLAAVGAGFWLSFVAVALLLWFGAWRFHWSTWRRLLGVHCWMALLMLPLGLHFFGGASLVSALANLFMVPLVGLWVVPAALLAVVIDALWPLVQDWPWRLAAWPLTAVMDAMQALPAPVADGLLLPGTLGGALLVMAVVAVWLSCLPGLVAVRIAALVLLVAAALPVVPRGEDNSESLEVTVLDVGQGTAVLVRQGTRALLYDTGGGDPARGGMARSVLLPHLRHAGIGELDTLIVSHADLDHAAGLTMLLETVPVARVRLGPGFTVPGARAGLPCRAGESWRWPGGVTFRLLSPAPAFDGGRNDSSCVLRVAFAGRAFLLPGDIEADMERQLVRYWGRELNADWLLAGHHGSNTSSAWSFLKHVTPGWAVYSAAYANRFGHPHPAVRRRLRQAGAGELSTASHGALVFHVSGSGEMAISAWRQKFRRHWLGPLPAGVGLGL